MDMRVEAQIARPGLQNPQHAKLSAQKARILGQLLQRRSRGSKQQRVDCTWLALRKRT